MMRLAFNHYVMNLLLHPLKEYDLLSTQREAEGSEEQHLSGEVTLQCSGFGPHNPEPINQNRDLISAVLTSDE